MDRYGVFYNYKTIGDVLLIIFDQRENPDEVIKQDPKFPKESYYSYKNYITTMGTIGASILSSNIVTPIIRNSMASDMQKKYLNNRASTSGNIKI